MLIGQLDWLARETFKPVLISRLRVRAPPRAIFFLLFWLFGQEPHQLRPQTSFERVWWRRLAALLVSKASWALKIADFLVQLAACMRHARSRVRRPLPIGAFFPSPHVTESKLTNLDTTTMVQWPEL